MLNKKIIFIVILSSFFTTNCNSQVNIPDSLSGMLLYLEDLDGSGGSMDGDFSDIVSFDLRENKKYIITEDKYFDSSPTYSKKTNLIYFESKRKDYNWVYGLSAESHIYYIDLKTKKVTYFNSEKYGDSAKGDSPSQFFRPVVSSSGEKIIFETFPKTNLKYYNLYEYNSITNAFRSLIDSVNRVNRYIWSEDETLFAYDHQDSLVLSAKTNCIRLFNLNTNQSTKLFERYYIRNLLGDYKYDKILYIEKDWNQNGKLSLYIYNIGAKEKISIGNIIELGFREIKTPVFKDENTIFFIGNKDMRESKFDEDIYEMNLLTKKIKQITFTHNIKDDLRYYE